MTERASQTDHPSPQRDKTSPLLLLFAVFGGPLAWFVVLNVGYLASSNPCFAMGERRTYVPVAHFDVRMVVAAVVCGLCFLLAAGAALYSLRLLRRSRGEIADSDSELLEEGDGRTHFLAMWGLITGIGFAVVILAHVLALIVVPGCAG